MQGLQGTAKAQDSVPANHKPGQTAVPATTTTPPRRFYHLSSRPPTSNAVTRCHRVTSRRPHPGVPAPL